MIAVFFISLGLVALVSFVAYYRFVRKCYTEDNIEQRKRRIKP